MSSSLSFAQTPFCYFRNSRQGFFKLSNLDFLHFQRSFINQHMVYKQNIYLLIFAYSFPFLTIHLCNGSFPSSNVQILLGQFLSHHES